MDFEENEDQALLRASLRQFLAQHYATGARTAASRSASGWRDDIWRAFANELGLLALGIPEEQGGLASGETEQAIVMEECGRALVIEPVAETLFQAAPLLAKSASTAASDLLSRIPTGDARLAVAVGEPGMREDFAAVRTIAVRNGDRWSLSGTKSVVVGAPWATHLLVAAREQGAELALFVVPAKSAGVALFDYPTIDGRRAGDVDLCNVIVPADAQLGGPELVEEWRDRAIAAMAAEAVGVLGRLLDDTVAYAKERQQFGKAIGSFQALQHRMVDMYLWLEMLRAAALLASARLDAEPKERARAASAAKVTLAEACRFIGQNAVQLHGAMGMTDELAVGHYFKRATVMEHAFGRGDWHRARHAALSG